MSIKGKYCYSSDCSFHTLFGDEILHTSSPNTIKNTTYCQEYNILSRIAQWYSQDYPSLDTIAKISTFKIWHKTKTFNAQCLLYTSACFTHCDTLITDIDIGYKVTFHSRFSPGLVYTESVPHSSSNSLYMSLYQVRFHRVSFGFLSGGGLRELSVCLSRVIFSCLTSTLASTFILSSPGKKYCIKNKTSIVQKYLLAIFPTTYIAWQTMFEI